MSAPRLPDWPRHLLALVEARRATPFAWGSHDCALFAADAVLAITGQDPAADLRGTYSTALGAARLIEARGGLEGIATAALGEPIAPALAGRGDVVLMAEGQTEGPCLCVCLGEMSWGPGADGVVPLPTLAAAKAWRV